MLGKKDLKFSDMTHLPRIRLDCVSFGCYLPVYANPSKLSYQAVIVCQFCDRQSKRSLPPDRWAAIETLLVKKKKTKEGGGGGGRKRPMAETKSGVYLPLQDRYFDSSI